MGRGKLLSERETGKIDAYFELGVAKRDISRRLRRSVHAITTYITNSATYGTNFKGRAPVMTPRECRRLRTAASNASKSLPKLKRELGITASCQTMRRNLRKMDIHYKRMRCRPPLTPAHRANRVTFCRRYMQQDWNKVWFTDEKRWCLDGPDRVGYYWHDLGKDPLIRSKRQAGGGSLMVWGGICGGKWTTLSTIPGTLNSEGYQQVLRDHFLPFKGPNESLMQDNASVHTSASTKRWLNSSNVDMVEWPSRSPDLNPIENVWGILVRRVYAEGKQYENLRELQNAIEVCWQDMRAEEIQNLTNSMCNRIFTCIRRNGRHVDY